MEFLVGRGCRNCAELPFSKFPGENEWLMPPYTPVRYVGQEMREFPSRDSCLVVTFQVLDGKNVDLHLMSCLIMCDTQAADAHYAKMKHAQSLWPGFVDSFAQPLV